MRPEKNLKKGTGVDQSAPFSIDPGEDSMWHWENKNISKHEIAKVPGNEVEVIALHPVLQIHKGVVE